MSFKRHRIFAILLLVAFSFSLVGCDLITFTPEPTSDGPTVDISKYQNNPTNDEDETEDPVTPTDPTPTDPTPTVDTTLKLNGVNITDYTVVYSSTSSSVSSVVYSYFKTQMSSKYGYVLKTATSTSDRYEILIGLDGNNTTVKKAYESVGDGAYIGVSGKKVYLLGVNEIALKAVVDAFLNSVVSGTPPTITVSSGRKVTVPKDTVTVLSYNVQLDLEKEGRPTDALAQMTATLSAQNPDVFGTQEDTSTISSYFLNNLSGYSCYIGPDDNWKVTLGLQEHIGNYIYYKTSKFNVIEQGFYYLTETPTVRSKVEASKEYRTFSYLILEVKTTGKRFLFINTHPDYRGKDAARKPQMQALSEVLKTLNANKLPVIILGDFNATPTEGSLKAFMSSNPNIKLTNEVALTKGDTGHTLIVSQFTTRDKYTFDHIFISTERIVAKYFSVIDNQKDGKYPSDHLPVVAKLDIY